MTRVIALAALAVLLSSACWRNPPAWPDARVADAADTNQTADGGEQ